MQADIVLQDGSTVGWPRWAFHMSNRCASTRRHVTAGLASVLVVLLGEIAVAGPVGAEFQVSTSANDEKTADVGVAADGSFVVVWEDKTDSDILARRYDASGNPLGAAFQVSTSANLQQQANIGIATDGSFVVVWTDKTDSDILARRYDASGNPLGAVFQVSTSANQQQGPDIGIAADGSFVIVWEDGTASVVLARRYDASGTPLGAVFQLNTSANSQKSANIAVATDGSFVAAWDDRTDLDILARRYDASGNPLGAVFQVSTAATQQWRPSTGVAADGSFVIAWADKTDSDILARRYDASGNPLGAVFEVPTSANQEKTAKIAVATDGSFVVVWEDTTATDVMSREYSASGDPLGGELVVNTTTAGIQGAPGIFMNANGDYVVVWTDSNTLDIYGQRYASASGGASFTDVSTTVGFDVQTTNDPTSGSGLHWADYDDDGDLDVIITGNSTSRLLTSTNEGASFTASSFGGGARSRQAAMVDIDNDGDIDLWHRDEILYENDGSATFTSGGDLGFGDATTNEAVAAADVNSDGYCDIVMFSGNGNWIGHHQRKVAESLIGTNGATYGLNDIGDFGTGEFCSSGDVNADGYVDFFYHYGSGKLFLSDGDGSYTENASGISVVTGGSDRVGSAWADYDNDGDLDLFVPRNASGQRGYLWKNTAGTFADVSVAAGVTDTSAQTGCCWGDYDNDGDLDLYICTASGDSVLYQNQGDGTFVTADEGAGASGNSHDAVFVDYDNDGDLDLAVTLESGTNVLLQNGTDDSSYLKVRVIGHGFAMTNKAAIGVRVELYASDASTFIARREIGVARGYGGTEPLWVHFGGVTNSTTHVVKVHFDSGIQEVTVVPQSVSTTIGATVISQMLTVQERKPRIISWKEVDPNS